MPRVIKPNNTITNWKSFTMVIESVSDPQPGKNAAPTEDSAIWRQVGSCMEINYQYKAGAGTAIGTGVYLFRLPTGHTVDTSVIESTSVVGSAATDDAISNKTGVCLYFPSGGDAVSLLIGTGFVTPTLASSTHVPMNGVVTQYGFFATLPIKEFR